MLKLALTLLCATVAMGSVLGQTLKHLSTFWALLVPLCILDGLLLQSCLPAALCVCCILLAQTVAVMEPVD